MQPNLFCSKRLAGGERSLSLVSERVSKGIDATAAQKAIADLLAALGQDVGDPQLRDTPRRVAAALSEMLSPAAFSFTTFPNDDHYDELVVVRDIPVHSLCAHHMLPFIGVAHRRRPHPRRVPRPDPKQGMTPDPDSRSAPGAARAENRGPDATSDPALPRHTRRPVAMTKLQRLHADHAQSPWLDNLSRGHLRHETLARMVDTGIRGVTANPTILARAIERSTDYDEQFSSLTAAGYPVADAYWELVIADIAGALGVLRPVFDASGGADGFVSVEVAPELARDTGATVSAARQLHERIDQPNLLVKIPATAEGVPAVEAMTAEGRSINITLIFSLARYAQVIEAYLSGLETFTQRGGDPSQVHSVASFFVSRVDTEVDRRLEVLGTDDALGLRGRAAVAQAKLAYQLFSQRFSGLRWERLARLGAHRQRPLWASTSTKNPAYPDTLYVDGLIGPDTVNTLPEATIAAFENHGTLSRTIDANVEEAADVLGRLATAGIDMDDVGLTLERKGLAAFSESFERVLAALEVSESNGALDDLATC